MKNNNNKEKMLQYCILIIMAFYIVSALQLPGGNQVDGLPPAVSRLTLTEYMTFLYVEFQFVSTVKFKTFFCRPNYSYSFDNL